MDNIRWGLLSTANINRRVIPAIRQSEHGELVAVASRSQESADSYAAKWEIPQAFASYDAMLNSDTIDAVYISLPNHLHAPWTVRALEAGKHVLCEKPFALYLDQVDAVIAAQRRTGKVVSEAFMYRFHPQMKILRQWIDEGKLGDIEYVTATFGFPVAEDADNIRLDPEVGGGSLWDVGVYPLSFAQFVYGQPPHTVTATQKLGPTNVDVTFSGHMQYHDGGVAHIESSFRTVFHQSASVIGTKGAIEIARPFTHLETRPDGMTYTPAGGVPTPIPVPDEYLYLSEVKAMHAAILDGEPLSLTLFDSRNHIKTALALYRAADEERPVMLAELE